MFWSNDFLISWICTGKEGGGEGEPDDSHIEKPIDTTNIFNIS